MKLRRPRHLRRTLVAGATGIVVAIVALAVAEALTVVARSWRSPVLDVGDRMVDLMSQYPRLKQAAIDLLGNADKPALLIGIGVFLSIYAFVLGVVAIRRSLRVGLAMIGLFAVIGVWAALGRKSDGSLFSTLPTIIGSLAAGAALWVLHPRIATTPQIAEASTDEEWGKPTLALRRSGGPTGAASSSAPVRCSARPRRVRPCSGSAAASSPSGGSARPGRARTSPCPRPRTLCLHFPLASRPTCPA